MSNPAQKTERVLWIIMAAVLVWGTFHALGAYLYNHHWERPAMVLGCVAAFLAWWAWLLGKRRRSGTPNEAP